MHTEQRLTTSNLQNSAASILSPAEVVRNRMLATAAAAVYVGEQTEDDAEAHDDDDVMMFTRAGWMTAVTLRNTSSSKLPLQRLQCKGCSVTAAAYSNADSIWNG